MRAALSGRQRDLVASRGSRRFHRVLCATPRDILWSRRCWTRMSTWTQS